MNINQTPLITIGITAFNEGKILQEAWTSVINQSSSMWNAVMVLDGDATSETKKYFDKITAPNLFKIQERTNQGPYWCRTKAIKNCSTEWYFHLDGDDRLPLDTIRQLNIFIEENPTLDYIWGKCLFFNKNEYFIQYVEKIDPEKQACDNQILGTSPIRKKMFQELDGFHRPLFSGGADWEFWTRVISNRYKGAFLNKIIYERRKRDGNVGANWLLNRDKVAQIIIKNNPEYFNIGGREEKCLGRAYELISRNYRSLGKRKKATDYARLAANIGWNFKAQEEITKENEMSMLRYIIRRIMYLF